MDSYETYGDYQNILPTQIGYDLDSALPYGEMPVDFLVKKFEETRDLDDGEGAYDDYARMVVKDRSPDQASFASDLPRKDYKPKGYLNLLHNGGRGEYNYPAHPEIFLELTEREPRGIAVDPDYQQLVKQEKARLRFIRYDADADNSIPEGRWGERTAFYNSRVRTQKAIQPRARVFSTSKDGRREGLRREDYPHVSQANMVEEDLNNFRPQSSTFSDYITDWALNPQRRTSILSNEIIRNSRMYQQNTSDHEFQVARYGRSNPYMKLKPRTDSTVGDIQKEDASHNMTGDEIPNEDGCKAYKAVGILMGALVNQKQRGQGDQLTPEEQKSLAIKTGKLQKDIMQILEATKTDTDWKVGDQNLSLKYPVPKLQDHLLALQEMNHHMLPANMVFNAELMYKSLQPGADLEGIRREVITDGRRAPKAEAMTIFGKTSHKAIQTGKKESIMEVDGKSLAPQVYKSSYGKISPGGVNQFNGEAFAQASDPTQIRKASHVGHRTNDTRDVSPDTDRQFYENYEKDRHIGPMGKDKFGLRRHTQFSHDSNGISSIS